MENTRMKRKKYQPRTGNNHGEFRITDGYIKSIFGDDYTVVWNGHNHFAQNIHTKELFAIDKGEKQLIPLFAIASYCDRKRIQNKVTQAHETKRQNSRWGSLSDEEIYILKRMAIESQSSFYLDGNDGVSYSESEKKQATSLLNELIEEETQRYMCKGVHR